MDAASTAGERKASVFISYRRQGGFLLAKYIYDKLRATGYDVFMDVHSLGAGEFEHTTLREIAARDYFLLVLTSGSLDRMTQAEDWLRKELSQAVKHDRKVIPVLADGIKFDDPGVRTLIKKLPAALRTLPSYNAIRMPEPEYFDSAMERLMSFLRTLADATPRGESTAGTSHADAQSVLQKFAFPPARSLTGTDSRTPWSDLQTRLIGSDLGGVEAPPAELPRRFSDFRLPGLNLLGSIASPVLQVLHGPNSRDTLTWTEIDGAERYLLEESFAADFSSPETVYEGSATSWAQPLWMFLSSQLMSSPAKHYRVKAIAEDDKRSSGWSNTASVEARKPLLRPRPAAPELSQAAFGTMLMWTEVDDAETYVLQRDTDPEFRSPTTVYDGSNTRWMELSSTGFRPSNPRFPWAIPPDQTDTPAPEEPRDWRATRRFHPPSSPVEHFRVKAIGSGTAGESDWSNTIAIARESPA